MNRPSVVLPDESRIVLEDDPWEPERAELRESGSDPPRLVFAAAHLVMHDSYARVAHTPDCPAIPQEIAAHIDWEGTTAFRRHLISRGFGIAEAMDTAQRYDVGWPIARELIERCGALRPPTGFMAGAGTDQLAGVRRREDLVDAVVDQCAIIRAAGGWPMILAMPWLSLHGCDESAYVDVYTAIIRQCEGPLFIHWLGPMFLDALRGYFPGEAFDRIMEFDPAKVRGCKLSMLDETLERGLRTRLAARDQIMLTGDDFHFGSLMTGTPTGSTVIDGRTAATGDLSHALLGIFDAVSAPASLALRALGAGREEIFSRIMLRCETLGRVIFEPPTQHYKVGLAFLAWLNGLQPNHMLPNHLEAARDAPHLCRVLHAAALAGCIERPEIARRRIEAWANSCRGA